MPSPAFSQPSQRTVGWLIILASSFQNSSPCYWITLVPTSPPIIFSTAFPLICTDFMVTHPCLVSWEPARCRAHALLWSLMKPEKLEVAEDKMSNPFPEHSTSCTHSSHSAVSLMLGTIQEAAYPSKTPKNWQQILEYSRCKSVLPESLLLELSAILLRSFCSQSDFSFLPSTWWRGVMKQEQLEADQGEQHQSRSHHRHPTQVGEYHPPAGIHVTVLCAQTPLPAWEPRGNTRGTPHLLKNPHTQLLTQVTAPVVPPRTAGTASLALLPYTRVASKTCWGRCKLRFQRLVAWTWVLP